MGLVVNLTVLHPLGSCSFAHPYDHAVFVVKQDLMRGLRPCHRQRPAEPPGKLAEQRIAIGEGAGFGTDGRQNQPPPRLGWRWNLAVEPDFLFYFSFDIVNK